MTKSQESENDSYIQLHCAAAFLLKRITNIGQDDQDQLLFPNSTWNAAKAYLDACAVYNYRLIAFGEQNAVRLA